MTEPDHVSGLTHVTDHVAGGKALLARMFRKPVIEALLGSWLTQVQAIEDAAWQVYNGFDLDDAIGAQLDAIGSVVGLARGDIATDALYRRALRAWIIANASHGDGDTITRLVDVALDGAGFAVTPWPAAAFVVTAPVVDIGAVLLASMLRRAAASGVGAQLVAPVDSGATFVFSADSETSTTSSTRGFADAGQTSGGHLVGAWE